MVMESCRVAGGSGELLAVAVAEALEDREGQLLPEGLPEAELLWEAEAQPEALAEPEEEALGWAELDREALGL